MRIFISEYLTSGAWPSDSFPRSLLAEGRGMLAAAVRDFLAVEKNEVRTTWDARLTSCPLREDCRMHVDLVNDPHEESRYFSKALDWADAALLIAPETGGILEQRVRGAVSHGVAAFNAAPEAIALCADKLRLARHLEHCHIPTPRTWLWEDFLRGVPDGRLQPNYVLKHRWGAGSEGMQLLSGDELFDLVRRARLVSHRERGTWVVQPLLPGRPISVAAVFDDCGRLSHVFPVAEQHLATDGSFRYLGGTLPAGGIDAEGIRQLIARTALHIAGLRGYIGFDLIVPDQSPHEPVLIEINPRLTTSYLGYSALCTQPLARWLDPRALPHCPPRFEGRWDYGVGGAGAALGSGALDRLQ